MAHIITMPKFGLTMTEGTVSHWCKSVGDSVQAGEALFEVQTDKITNEVESPQTGILRQLFVTAGSTVDVGAALAIVAEADEDISDLLTGKRAAAAHCDGSMNKDESIQATSGVIQSESNGSTPIDGFILATPLARKKARENQTVLTRLDGTGPNGIIVARDVTSIVEGSRQPAISPLAKKWAQENEVDWPSIRQAGRIMLPDVITEKLRTSSSENIDRSPTSTRVEVMKGMRKVIATRMTQSWQQIPHVTLTRQLDVTELKKAADLFRSDALVQDVTKITLTHILIKIVATALSASPMLNAWCDGESITYHSEVNMGIAVAVPDGLYVPVIRQACQKSIETIAGELAEFSARARNQQLSAYDLTGGTFTISNLGMLGVDGFTPIINQPQTGILGIGRAVDKPIFIGDQLEKRTMMTVSLSFDHRALDGAEAALFLQRIHHYVEQPLRLLAGGR